MHHTMKTGLIWLLALALYACKSTSGGSLKDNTDTASPSSNKKVRTLTVNEKVSEIIFDALFYADFAPINTREKFEKKETFQIEMIICSIVTKIPDQGTFAQDDNCIIQTKQKYKGTEERPQIEARVGKLTGENARTVASYLSKEKVDEFTDDELNRTIIELSNEHVQICVRTTVATKKQYSCTFKLNAEKE